MENTDTPASLGLRTYHQFDRGNRQLGYSVTPPKGVLDDPKTGETYVGRVLSAILSDKASQLYSDKVHLEVTEGADQFKSFAEGFIARQRWKLNRANRFRFLLKRRVVPGVFVISALFFAGRYLQLGIAPTESIEDLAYGEVGIGAGMAYVKQTIKFYTWMAVASSMRGAVCAALVYAAGRGYAKMRFPTANHAMDYASLSAPLAAMFVPAEELPTNEQEIYNDPF